MTGIGGAGALIGGGSGVERDRLRAALHLHSAGQEVASQTNLIEPLLPWSGLSTAGVPFGNVTTNL